jgi:5-methyltetrahydropteroyltriglutamate--homocysteine methyltransferase
MAAMTAESAPAARRNFRADTVGSLLRPDYLLRARANFAAGTLNAEELRDAEDKAIREVVRMQEEVGLEVVTDGEYRRENWYAHFVGRLCGVVIAEASTKGFTQNSSQPRHVPKRVQTVGKVFAPQPIVLDDFLYLSSITNSAAKVTIPSPTRLHFYGGRNAVAGSAYPDIENFFADVAAVYQSEVENLERAGCRYIQIDDPLLSYFLDPTLRQEVIVEGDDPDRRLASYVKWINDCISKRSQSTTVAIHICRGNARSSWISQGSYDGIAQVCFTGLDVDRFLLEYDDERSGGFEPLRLIPKGKEIVLGLITTKRPHLEDKAEIMRRIDQATKYAGLDQLAVSPQCGFASVVEGNLISHGDQIAKLRLVVEVAREVWGER